MLTGLFLAAGLTGSSVSGVLAEPLRGEKFLRDFGKNELFDHPYLFRQNTGRRGRERRIIGAQAASHVLYPLEVDVYGGAVSRRSEAVRRALPSNGGKLSFL